MDQQPSMSREPSVFLVSMASSISAAVYVDSHVSTNYEPSVFLVSMASDLSAAVREVWSLELLQIISLCGWSRTDGSAAVREP